MFKRCDNDVARTHKKSAVFLNKIDKSLWYALFICSNMPTYTHCASEKLFGPRVRESISIQFKFLSEYLER